MILAFRLCRSMLGAGVVYATTMGEGMYYGECLMTPSGTAAQRQRVLIYYMNIHRCRGASFSAAAVGIRLLIY